MLDLRNSITGARIGVVDMIKPRFIGRAGSLAIARAHRIVASSR
jgi:hypothetical protein